MIDSHVSIGFAYSLFLFVQILQSEKEAMVLQGKQELEVFVKMVEVALYDLMALDSNFYRRRLPGKQRNGTFNPRNRQKWRRWNVSLRYLINHRA